MRCGSEIFGAAERFFSAFVDVVSLIIPCFLLAGRQVPLFASFRADTPLLHHSCLLTYKIPPRKNRAQHLALCSTRHFANLSIRTNGQHNNILLQISTPAK